MNKFIILFISLIAQITFASKTIKVLVIDSGTDLSHIEISSHVKNPDSINYLDLLGHGTHVSGIILKNTCKEIELISCTYWFENDDSKERINKSINCFRKALKYKVQIVNYSSIGSIYYLEEYKVLKQLEKAGIILVTAAGNDNKDIGLDKNPAFPAKYLLKNIIVVGSLTDDGFKANSSNYGLKGMVFEKGVYIYSTLPNGKFGYMTGTSQATAKRTNKILLKWCQKL